MSASSLEALRAVFYLILAISTISAGPVIPSKNGGKTDDISYRLPNTTRPVVYDIHITTNIDKGDLKFTGKVVIFLEVSEKSTDIILHARQLTIDTVALESAGDPLEHYEVKSSYDEITEFLKITSEGGEIEKGVKRLEIDYTGELRKDHQGFYISTYTNENGDTVNLAATQFEATDARHAFPCYDEPAKKAIFNLKITHGKNYTAISNMPVMGEIEENDNSTVTTTFEPTRLMSTYLVAFVVSDFVGTEIFNRYPHRIYSRPESVNDQKFALEISGDILNSIEDYLHVEYSLPKMDSVAISYFEPTAMENWGLVICRENYILYDEKKSTSEDKKGIAIVQAHEFGHQWFGNLVSPFWWTFIWLNEGFASIFAYIATDAIFPEWDIWQDYIVSDLQMALLADGMVSPRSMTHYVESPNEISDVFDEISYLKACSVLTMFRHALTDSVFKKALNDYLQKLEYESAVEDDLFESFKHAAQKDIIFGNATIDLLEMFKSWTNQGGYPLITVERDYNEGTFTIRQEPFDGTANTPETDKRSWWVPYNFATANGPQFNITEMNGYLNIGESTKTIAQGDQQWSRNNWIILNKQATSYYRVNYDNQNWKLLTQALRADPLKIHAHNRAQLLDDAFRLAMAKRLEFATLLDLSEYLKKEHDYAPWMTANKFLTTFNDYLYAHKEYTLFQYYVGKIVGDFYKNVSATESNDDALLRKIIRSVAVNWACRANFGNCIQATGNRLRELIAYNTEIEPNMRTSIFCNGMIKADENNYNFMLNRLMNSTDPAERSEISSAFGCMQNVQLLQRYLRTSIDHTAAVKYKEQERLNVVTEVIGKGAIQLATAIDFLKENHAEYAKLKNGSLPRAIHIIARSVTSKIQETHFESLLALLENIGEIDDSYFAAVRATVKTNLDWFNENCPKIIEWLRKFKNDNLDEGGSIGPGEGGGAPTIVISTSVMFLVITVTFRPIF